MTKNPKGEAQSEIATAGRFAKAVMYLSIYNGHKYMVVCLFHYTRPCKVCQRVMLWGISAQSNVMRFFRSKYLAMASYTGTLVALRIANTILTVFLGL